MSHLKVKTINGKPVVDATYSMALTIDEKDVKDGARKNSKICAAAVACMRHMDALSARVHVARTYVEYPKRWLRFRTPAALRGEIVAFDRGGEFKPGTYYLNPLSASERPTGRRQGYAPKNNSKSRKKRAKPHYVEGVRSMSNLHQEFDVKYERTK